MTYHVITARVYTGAIFYLCEGQEGKLGGWCKQIMQCKQFRQHTEADVIFDAISSILDGRGKSSIVDSKLFKYFEDRARLIDLCVEMMDSSLILHRRRIIDLGRLKDPFGSMVLQMAQ